MKFDMSMKSRCDNWKAFWPQLKIQSTYSPALLLTRQAASSCTLTFRLIQLTFFCHWGFLLLQSTIYMYVCVSTRGIHCIIKTHIHLFTKKKHLRLLCHFPTSLSIKIMQIAGHWKVVTNMFLAVCRYESYKHLFNLGFPCSLRC